MTFLCNCQPPETDCSLQEVIRSLLEGDAAGRFQAVGIYTGNLVTQADTDNLGPPLPHLILSDLGPINERFVGEATTQHEVIVRFQFYAATEAEGRRLWRAAAAIIRNAGSLGFSDGWACMGLPALGRSWKVGGEKWGTQANQLFVVYTSHLAKS